MYDMFPRAFKSIMVLLMSKNRLPFLPTFWRRFQINIYSFRSEQLLEYFFNDSDYTFCLKLFR